MVIMEGILLMWKPAKPLKTALFEMLAADTDMLKRGNISKPAGNTENYLPTYPSFFAQPFPIQSASSSLSQQVFGASEELRKQQQSFRKSIQLRPSTTTPLLCEPHTVHSQSQGPNNLYLKKEDSPKKQRVLASPAKTKKEKRMEAVMKAKEAMAPDKKRVQDNLRRRNG